MESKVLRQAAGLSLVEVTDDNGNIHYEIQNSRGKVLKTCSNLDEIESLFNDMVRRNEIAAERRRDSDRGGPSL